MVPPGPTPRSRTGPGTEPGADGGTEAGGSCPASGPSGCESPAAEPRARRAQPAPGAARVPLPRGTGVTVTATVTVTVTVPARPPPLRWAAAPAAGRERPKVVRSRTMRRGLFVLPPAGGGERRPRGRVGGRSSPQVPGRDGPAEPSPGPVTKSRGAQPHPVPPRPGAGWLGLWRAAPAAGLCERRVWSSAALCPVLSRPVPAALRLPAWGPPRGWRGSRTPNASVGGKSDFPQPPLPLQALHFALPAGGTHQYESGAARGHEPWNAPHLPPALETPPVKK